MCSSILALLLQIELFQSFPWSTSNLSNSLNALPVYHPQSPFVSTIWPRSGRPALPMVFIKSILKHKKVSWAVQTPKAFFLYADCWGTFVASGAGWKCLNFWYFFGFDFFPKFFGPTGYKNELAYTKPMQWIKVHTHVCREWYAHQVDLGMRSFMMWYFYVSNAS